MRAEDHEWLVLNQAELDQFAKALVDLGQLCAGSDGDDDLVGNPPAELLGDLVPQSLRALRVIGPDVDVDEGPALFFSRDLSGELVDVVVGALDGDQGRVIDGGSQDFLPLEIVGYKDNRLDACPGSGCGNSIGEVPGGRAGQNLKPQLAGRREGDCDDAVLERMRRIARVVLDPELFQTKIIREIAGIDQPGETGVGRAEGGDVGWDRQQRGISPDAPRARLDPFAGNGRKLVADLERTEALGTGVEGAERCARPTFPTDQVRRVSEGACPDARSGSRIGVNHRGHHQSFFIFLSRLSAESELAPFLIGQSVAGESSGRSLVPSG